MDFLNVVRCCTPALPSAYADALSYYDALCKLQGAVNECINILNGYLDEVDKKIAEAILSENVCNIIERIQAVYIPELEAISFGVDANFVGNHIVVGEKMIITSEVCKNG